MRIIINLMISYCQCRRQAIPPLEGQCRRGSEQESSWKTIIGSCCDSSVPGSGIDTQRRMSPTTRICAFWSAPVKRRSSIRRLFCTGRRSTWRWTSTVAAGCAGRNPWRSWTTRRAWPVPRRRRWSTRAAPGQPAARAGRVAGHLPQFLPVAQAGRPVPFADRRTSQYFPQPGGKAHRQRDEALSGAHARMGSRLISLFVLGNA